MILIENYKKYLQTIKADKKAKIDQFVTLQCDDDATLSRIELNIIEIFEQMFGISEKKSIAQKENALNALKETYLGFFDKIPNNWIIQLEQCQKFGDEEGAFKETLKINQANAMKKAFVKMLEEATHETR